MSGSDIVHRYEVDPGGLDNLTKQLRDGAAAFDGIAANAPVAPDCGSSTANAAKAIAKLVAAAAALGAAMNDTAEKVHSANGSYDTIENVVTKGMLGTARPT